MKILMIAPQCFLLPRGTPLSILQRLRALTLQGHQIDLITYPFGEDIDLPGLTIHRVGKPPGLREVKVGPSCIKTVLDLFIFCKAIKLLRRERYDLIHSHEEGAYFGWLLSRWFGLRHLYDMHSSLPQQLSNFDFCNVGPCIKVFSWLEKQTIRHSDSVIVVYPQLLDHVKALEPRKRAFLIENVEDLSKLNGKGGTTDALRQTYGINGRKVVLYTGSFEPYQGLDLLVESAQHVIRRVEHVLFLCVGGSKEQIERLKQLVSDHGLDAHFELPGSVPFYDVPAHLELADVLVSPRTKGNNTPLKIYSYLRSGRPIVATNLATHAQVLNSKVALLTDPTPEAFAEGIVELLDNPELRRTLGQRAMKLAEEKYSYSVLLAQTRAALDPMPHALEV